MGKIQFLKLKKIIAFLNNRLNYMYISYKTICFLLIYISFYFFQILKVEFISLEPVY